MLSVLGGVHYVLAASQGGTAAVKLISKYLSSFSNMKTKVFLRPHPHVREIHIKWNILAYFSLQGLLINLKERTSQVLLIWKHDNPTTAEGENREGSQLMCFWLNTFIFIL